MVLVLFVVAHIATMRDRALFGPIPWRIMVVARSLLLFAALAAFPRVRLEGRRALALTAIVAVLCLSWANERGRLLSIESGGASDSVYREVHDLFGEVARVAPSIEGRVYVQNTHGIAAPPLGGGHPLALLSARSGVHGVGSYYSLVPFATDLWLTSFAGPVVGHNATDSSRPLIDERLDDLGAELVVLVDRPTVDVMSRWGPEYSVVARTGRFVLLRRRRPGMARSDDANATVENVRIEDGRVEVDVSSAREHDLMLAVSYALRWAIEEAPEGTYLARRRNGLMRIHLPRGRHHVVLQYRPPLWPLVLSAFGWLMIVGWAARAFTRRRTA
jgi:hypothetical protein